MKYIDHEQLTQLNAAYHEAAQALQDALLARDSVKAFKGTLNEAEFKQKLESLKHNRKAADELILRQRRIQVSFQSLLLDLEVNVEKLKALLPRLRKAMVETRDDGSLNKEGLVYRIMMNNVLASDRLIQDALANLNSIESWIEEHRDAPTSIYPNADMLFYAFISLKLKR